MKKLGALIITLLVALTIFGVTDVKAVERTKHTHEHSIDITGDDIVEKINLKPFYTIDKYNSGTEIKWLSKLELTVNNKTVKTWNFRRTDKVVDAWFEILDINSTDNKQEIAVFYTYDASAVHFEIFQNKGKKYKNLLQYDGEYFEINLVTDKLESENTIKVKTAKSCKLGYPIIDVEYTLKKGKFKEVTNAYIGSKGTFTAKKNITTYAYRDSAENNGYIKAEDTFDIKGYLTNKKGAIIKACVEYGGDELWINVKGSKSIVKNPIAWG